MSWESGATRRIHRIGEGERLEDVYHLPYGTDAERHDLLRADCKRIGKLVEDLQWEVDEAWFAAEYPVEAAVQDAIVNAPSPPAAEIAAKLGIVR